MALQTSGTISLSNIQTEFGGTNPVSMSEYYRGGSYVTDNNTEVPTSGSIDLSDFYGTVNIFTFNITSNTENANVATLASAAGWDGSQPLICNINSGVYVWSDTTSSAGLIISGSFAGGLTVNNSGSFGGGINNNWGQVYNYATGNDKAMTKELIVDLAANDYVKMELHSTYNNFYWGGGYSYFGGHLIG